MKKFLLKILIFLSILTGVVLLLFFLEGDRLKTNEYMAALTDKHKRIENIKKPKIILAGGSNLVFGVDSETIERELETPIVNLGLLAKLGLKFILNELKDVAREGDLIVLSIEHDMTIQGNLELQKMTSYYNSFAHKYYRNQDELEFGKYVIEIENCHLLFKKTISSLIDKVKEDPAYMRSGLNKYGDGVYHLDIPSSNVLGSKSIIKANKDEEIELLNEFHLFAKEKGINVVFSYGAYEIREYEKNKVALHKVDLSMRENLTLEMIMDLEGFVYPTSYFFDSVYHLNKKGRIEHTKNLIFGLKNSNVFKQIQLAKTSLK
ncbi:hypothetical protein [Aquimarina sp. 2201CG5-10]|uniref:hypothetical protein n=1 Tax=Aquimarina callyspongiae TaxID=3098150 RepID=UPI002AB5622B|nr:hypothetical protein [Aquimarina sp. 2201CG5-10]MDY8136885.1 hypothetical protein [Aquimarina sp. 2201CG5-10]